MSIKAFLWRRGMLGASRQEGCARPSATGSAACAVRLRAAAGGGPAIMAGRISAGGTGRALVYDRQAFN